MALGIIAPPKKIEIDFALAPVYNAIDSLVLLNEAEALSGFDPWVYQTATALPQPLLRENELILHGLDMVEYADDTWPSVPAWLDDLAGRDPQEMRDCYLDRLVKRANQMLDDDVPSPAQLLADRAVYLSLGERMACCKEEKEAEFDQALWEEAYALLSDPPAMRERIVAHLRAMWDEVLAAEWERSLPDLQESVAAFLSLDLAATSVAEALRRVTGRELPADWEEWVEDVERVVFIPSPHIGPYLMLIERDGATAWLVFGARVPVEATAGVPVLSRSELLMRLSALADDTRLRILELLTGEEELSAQDVMTRLDLSQSAASRHLSQLAATGYLLAQRREGAKFYRLNRDRIDDTCRALKKFLH